MIYGFIVFSYIGWFHLHSSNFILDEFFFICYFKNYDNANIWRSLSINNLTHFESDLIG